MGNICGRMEDPEPILGRPILAPAKPAKTASRHHVGGPAHTLGGAAKSSPSSSAGSDDARRRAAEAAEKRAKSAGKGGKLQAQLSAQKKQSRSDTLAEASLQEIRARDADAAAEARNWD